MQFVARIYAEQAIKAFGSLKVAFYKAIEAGVEKAALALLRDCRPYVPILTGALRDSGHLVKALENFAFMLVWNAANPVNGYVYAQRQYEEVFQHVDGRYAAEWVEKTLKSNPGRYSMLASRYITVELAKLFRGKP